MITKKKIFSNIKQKNSGNKEPDKEDIRKEHLLAKTLAIITLRDLVCKDKSRTLNN
jgi:hypothetical protein